MSTDCYQSPLSERYASKEMQYIFSPDKKFRTWRRLWIALAETEKELGLAITQEQIDELKEHVDTDIISNEGICKWFDYDELNSLEMPFTAQYVIRHYLETGRLNDKVYGGIADGEKVVFIEMPEF